ncbi:DNA-3-methyladenine glycosylase 2 family protein [Halobacillus locisalis]|uniref:DNA-3-methyladenine glycosylase II n=1 Tax=Halobacillus locisalis TaxID=220753 RepID=A0A838CX22_9BACI|nr:DNA-3-methyladenine glycosylase [Halobacillus locisalis]MBA2176461.1 DNA-3-methyladenine glycosylase 2 family protein [Halobacillus locisalis]
MWKETFDTKSFYDFDYTLLRWAFDPLTKMDRDERWVDVPVRIGKDTHVVRVQGVGTTAHPKFEVSSESDESKSLLISHIQELFQWDRDLEQIHEHFMDTDLKALFENHPGTPIVKDFHLYDCLMKVIIHQQLNMKFAYTLSTRFVENFGMQKDGVWFYPTPEQVAELSYDQLRELQFSQRKAEYVIDTSQKIVDNELDLEDLVNESNEEVMRRLVKVRGIGPWTAENWLMFGLGRENMFPKADIGIQNALKHYYGLDKKPSYEQMDQWIEGWEPYLSYASLTLWRSIEG